MTRSRTKRVIGIKNNDGLQDREEGMKKTGSWSQAERDGELKTSQGQQGTERGEGKKPGIWSRTQRGQNNMTAMG